MGVRLYPVTNDPSTLEKLAGVPEGTFHRLEQHDKLEREAFELLGLDYSKRYHVGGDIIPDGEEGIGYLSFLWKEEVDQELGELENFLLNGWGKFRFPQGFPLDDADGAFGTYYNGTCRSPEWCRSLLLANGIDVDFDVIHGLSWG